MTENAEQIGAIAAIAARAEAVKYFEQERGKRDPLSVDYVALVVAGNIGAACYDEGYSYNALDAERRKEIARAALKAVGYPGAREVQ